jgi:hypothetical protein
MIDLIDSCITPTLAVFQIIRDGRTTFLSKSDCYVIISLTFQNIRNDSCRNGATLVVTYTVPLTNLTGSSFRFQKERVYRINSSAYGLVW